MGQFTLGLRSLLIKAAVFVIMAALLAWALGGTLWPKPSRVELPNISFQGQSLSWQLEARDGAAARELSFPQERIQWFLVAMNEKRPQRLSFSAIDKWLEVAGPVVHNGNLHFGGLVFEPSGSQWYVYSIDQRLQHTRHSMPDRLAVEQQLERLKAGLPLQDAETIMRQRQAVLDPQ